ncbi:MAG: TetR/AcrR family transcriptional regulator, partial [Terrimicrobiaceae bacterium]
MSKKQNPEIPQKLIDALIRTVIEQGFSPGIDAITERACVSKMTAYAQFTSRTGLTVAALERVGREVRKGLEQATRQSGCESSRDFRRVTDCLVQQLTDRDNPLAFITSCLLGHPDPRSRIHAAARKEHAAIADWLESYCKSSRTLNPQKAANAAIALIHGT